MSYRALLPKKFESYRSELDEETANAYLKRLGNLSLLEAKQNVDSDNKPFNQKKAIYQKSKFTLTEMVAQKSEWNIDAINERQEKLAKLASKAWPLSINDFPASVSWQGVDIAQMDSTAFRVTGKSRGGDGGSNPPVPTNEANLDPFCESGNFKLGHYQK